MLFVGGRGSTVGPIVGAGFLIIVPQLISGLERFQNLVFFTLLLVLILVRPSGLFGAAHDTIPLRTLLPNWTLFLAFGRAADTCPDDGRRARTEDCRGDKAVRRPDCRSQRVVDDPRRPSPRPDRAKRCRKIDDHKPDFRGVAPGFRPDHVRRSRPWATDSAAIARLGVARTFQQAAPLLGLSVIENVTAGMHRHYRSGITSVLLRLPHMRREARAFAGGIQGVVGTRRPGRRGRGSGRYPDVRQAAVPRNRASNGDAAAHHAAR